MIYENELVMLLLSVGVFLFIIIQRDSIRRFQEWKILVSGFLLLFFSCIFTVLEGFFWGHIFNYLEHGCYAASSLFLTVWCRRIFSKPKASI